MILRLYTQDNCKYCDIMKEKLNEWNLIYTSINISHNDIAKDFLKDYNVKTVPQLFFGNLWVTENINTVSLNKDNLLQTICNHTKVVK